jgi:hypothetical protein
VPGTDGVLHHTGAVTPTASALLPEQQTRLGRLLHPRGQQPSSAPISSLPMISSARGHRRFVSKQQSLNRRPILVLLNDSSRVCQAAATQFCIHENGALSAPIRRAGDAAASPAKQPSRRVLTARPAWLLPDNLGSAAASRSAAPFGLRAVAGAASATSAAASSPSRKRATRRRRGRPRPGRGMSPFAPARPRCPMEKAIQGHPRPHARASARSPEMYLA